MHTFIALLIAAAATFVDAMPPGSTPPMSPLQQPLPEEPSDTYLRDYLLPRMLTPNHFSYDERIPIESGEHEWLDKEIDRLSQMETDEEPLTPPLTSFEDELARWMNEISYVEQPYEGPMGQTLRRFVPRVQIPGQDIHRMPVPPKSLVTPEAVPNKPKDKPKEVEEEEQGKEEPKEVEEEEEQTKEEPKEVEEDEVQSKEEPKEVEEEEPNRQKLNEVEKAEKNREVPEEVVEKEGTREKPNSVKIHNKNESFAMTPLEEGYYEPAQKIIAEKSNGPHEGGESEFMEISPPRETRQNPNLGRTKNLVAENVGLLRAGLTNQAPDTTDKPHHNLHVLDNDPAEPIYSVALITAIGSALAMTIAGFAFGWYTLAKKAKAAAEVDYPAYGVTGPTVDPSGDRKLAHSAHMYHYQHQKQQIIAMERNGLEQRNGSMSDPESEEENEEGDYTVYECPGFATTGEMEVKNPLFNEEPTPATPGKCELVKPQPKE